MRLHLLDSLVEKNRFVTPVTPCEKEGVTNPDVTKHSNHGVSRGLNQDCYTCTPVTPQNTKNILKSDFNGLINPKLSISDKENIEEHLAERSAIMQFDGELSRPEAEKQARSNMRVFHYRITDKPAWLVMISPGYDINEAWHSLKTRFGERLLEVKEYSFKAEMFK